MYIKTGVTIVLLSIAAPWIYGRGVALSHMVSNAPHKITPSSSFKSEEVKFTDVIRNCEDGVIEEGMGIAILSCDAGRDRWNTVMGYFHEEGVVNGELWIYDYSTPDLSVAESLKRITFANFPSAEIDFHPLGIELYLPTSTLYVVNHAKRGSTVEIFQLSVSDATATHIRTLEHPLLQTPNAVTAINGVEIYISNDHHFKVRYNRILAKLETFLGIPGGSVVHMNFADDTAKVVANVAFANGIKFLNDTTLAVSSSSTERVILYKVTETRDLAFLKSITLPALPDNLSVDGNGKLLIAGHLHAPSIAVISQTRALCSSSEFQDRDECKVRAPSWVGEWSEEGGVKTLYQGVEFMSASTIMRDSKRGMGIITGLYEKGLLVFRC